MVKQVTDNCMKLIDKNINEMDSYFKQVFQDSQMQNYIENVEIGMASAADLPIRIKINEIIDPDGFTLLHMAAFKNKTKMFNFII